jgi:hypothetical protein
MTPEALAAIEDRASYGKIVIDVAADAEHPSTTDAVPL